MFKALLILALPASAETQATSSQWLTTSVSGYASYTAISDERFHPSSGIVAINGAVHYRNWALKAQVANRPEPIRRAALEFNASLLPRHSVTLQLGRVPRLATLYSDVYGNPSEWDMAVLPLAGYNRRMVHSLSFNAIDGAKLIYDLGVRNSLLRLSATYGRNIQEGCEWQLEAADLDACAPAWSLAPASDNWNLGLEARINAYWTLLTTYDYVHAQSRLHDPRDRRAAFLVRSLAQEVAYTYWRTGVRYAGEWGYWQAEHGENRTYFLQDLGAFRGPRGWQLQASSADDYVVVGYYLSDALTGFAGYSRGEKRGVDYHNEDAFVGVNFRHDTWTLTLEHHRGHGGWVRHGANDYDWQPLVASVTYSW